jgi:hypothetical protein
MRLSIYPERIVFHDNPGVIAELRAKAEREGLTFAEVMRPAARREVREAA